MLNDADFRILEQSRLLCNISLDAVEAVLADCPVLALAPGDVLCVVPVEPAALDSGDLVYCRIHCALRVRRFVRLLGKGELARVVVTSELDEAEIAIPVRDLLGCVRTVQRHGRFVDSSGTSIQSA